MNSLLVILILIAIAAFAIFQYFASQRRKKELSDLAGSWGFSWYGDDPFDIAGKYNAFHAVSRGHSPRAYDVFAGDRHGHETTCFDYRYTTGSGKSQSTHHLSGALLRHGHPFPELLVCPENLLDKLAEFVGFDDINFESAEFSRTFYVKSKDRKFAFDLFHARAMEYMLAQPRRYALEFRGDTVLITDDSVWSPGEFEPAIAQVEGLLELQHQLSNTEDRIQAARRFYNANVRDYNTRVEQFPSNLISGACGFQREEFFEIEPIASARPALAPKWTCYSVTDP